MSIILTRHRVQSPGTQSVQERRPTINVGLLSRGILAPGNSRLSSGRALGIRNRSTN